ncbi:putative cyclic AMP receptor-like protein A-like isoform X2 [Apostichopus japonicus]|uniref:Putative cyclic AMP receptor-like protein A-like isoform X2 n=1 Tax=Stichopus japonicus TaxID=307972 RepID=A0A2G8JUC0_STIJA|nr:putative cyclic AMP receptor-like protein A-like isoform X2 [Apostichopus japonicus]
MGIQMNSSAVSTCLSFYSPEECTIILIARIICAAASFLGSIFLITVICLFRKYKRLHYRILLYISICSFFNSLTILLVEDRDGVNGTWCILKGMSLQFNSWTILMWQLCLTVNLFLNVMSFRRPNSSRKIEGVYHVLCWGVSTVATMIPLVFGKYGPAITWCWISDHRWKVWAFYVEYLVIILVIFALYAKVVYTVLTLKPIWRERPTENHRYEVYKRLVRPMMLYPLAILLVSIFPIVYRALTFRKPFREPPFILAVFHIVSVPLWGTLFAIVYVLDPETRKDLHWLNIKNTIQDRIHGTRIREVQIKDYREATSPEATASAGQSAAPDRKSTISDVSIEPSTVYPHSIKK